MTSASRIIRHGDPAECRPVPRYILPQQAWSEMVRALPAEPGLAFTALWADMTHVHALFAGGEPLLASVAVEAGLYAAVSPARPAAALFERAAADLWGHQAAHAADTRPWLDHGTWPTLQPLSGRPVPNAKAQDLAEPDLPDMLDMPGDKLPIGPLAPGMAAPCYWRATLSGSEVGKLEARAGWAHRGVLGLMRDKPLAGAARIASRIDGAATVAHSTAFARATEAAAGIELPPLALRQRELMLAVERIMVRLHILHATGMALHAFWPKMLAAREALLEACAAAFGHRLMMDAVRPGGVAGDLSAAGLAALDAALAALPTLRHSWPGIGALPITDALCLAVPGTAGRASGRPDPGTPGAPIRTQGDLAARLELHALAVAEEAANARTLLANLPAGSALAILPYVAAEGLGVAEGPNGPVWHWVRLAHGTVTANFAAAPEWLLLQAAERAAAGSDVDKIPAIIASFGLHPAGIDL